MNGAPICVWATRQILFAAKFGVIFRQSRIVDLHCDSRRMPEFFAVEGRLEEIQYLCFICGLVLTIRARKLSNVFDGAYFLFGDNSWVLSGSYGQCRRQ